MTDPRKRIVVILAGPPGSGKSTLRDAAIAFKNLPPDSFLDTDALTKRLFGTYTKDNWKKAQAAAAGIKQDKIEQGEPLGFETILGSAKGVDFIREVKAKDYIVDVFYITTDSPEKCIERVKQRVSEGGHAIAPEDVRALYNLSLKHYLEAAKIADQTLFFDNTGDFEDPVLLFTTNKGILDYVNPKCPTWATPVRDAIKAPDVTAPPASPEFSI